MANTLSPDALAAMASVYALGCGFVITEDRALGIDNKPNIDVPREVREECARHYQEIRAVILGGIIPESLPVALDGLEKVEKNR